MPVARDPHPVLVRPSRSVLSQRGSIGGLIVWVIASLLYSLRFSSSTRLGMVAIAAAAAACFVALVALARLRTKLVIADGRLAFTSLLRTRVFGDSEVGSRIIEVKVAWANSNRCTHLWLFTKAGHAVVSLNRDAWDSGQLEQARKSLDLPLEVIDGPKSPKELRNLYPQSIPWWAAYPLPATVVTLVFIAAIVIALPAWLS
jgi:hypothetical protein